MRKLFLFIAAALVSTGMWATDPTLNSDLIPTGTLNAKVVDANLYAITNAVNKGKRYIVYDLDTIRVKMKGGDLNWVKGKKDDGGNSAGSISFASSDADVNFGFNSSWNRAWGINNARYAYIRVKNCSEFAALTKSNGTNNGKTLYIQVFKKNGEAWDYVETLGEDTYNNSKYYVLSATLDDTEEYIIVLTSGNSSNCLTAQVRFASPYCADPEATIIADQNGYVGEAIDLGWSTKNTNNVVWSIKKNDAETEDASISAGKFTATAAGTYVVTATQAADGTHCAVAAGDATVTLTIANAAAVETVTINSAASTARIKEEVALSMTAENATQYKWYVKKDAGEYTQVATTAGYTFSATEAGSYNIKCEARNDFNKDGEQNPTWVASSNTHTITVSISSDATLSDLKVNGTTIDGFAANKYEYTIADPLGVYELLTVTATATDAPYATYATTDNKTSTVTVTVTAEAGNTQDYTIGYTRKAATSLESIGASTTWDWTKAGSATAEQKATTMPTNAEEFNFADVLISPDDEFNAAALNGIAQFANRSDHYFQGNMVKFNTTVAGTVVVTYSNTGGKRPYRHVKVNETMSAEGSANQDQKDTEAINVSAGDVEITFYIPDATEPQSRDGDVVGPSMGRIYKIVFTKSGTVGVDNTESSVKAVKVLKNGMLIIEKNGVRYNMLGERVQ